MSEDERACWIVNREMLISMTAEEHRAARQHGHAIIGTQLGDRNSISLFQHDMVAVTHVPTTNVIVVFGNAAKYPDNDVLVAQAADIIGVKLDGMTG